MVGAASRRPTALSRDNPWPISAKLLCFLWSVLLVAQAAASNSAGCADGSREALLGFERVAGCAGQWAGHVRNASALCGPGWRVCSWYDHTLLSNITWSQATRYRGCYAFNAAQDGGLCQECRDDLEQDDLAGVGKDCAHQHRGESSCISGGRIDSSCCTDSHFHRACTYHSHLTGVLCCRMPVKPPVIVVKPPERTHVYTGLIFLLPCQATGMPPPRIQWYKNGEQMPSGHSRTSVLSSGDLLVTMARKSDTALYTCEVINDEGFDMASSYVTVSEYTSGCADDSTEGLHLHRDLQACGGRWEGHVRQGGKALCKKGWRVCNPKDRDSLAKLTWLDIFDLSGCYAYNAATGRRGRCTKCRRGKMAGVGRHCQWKRHSQTSCLARGRVDVQPPRSNSTSCTQVEGVTSGVLCCKRRKRKKKEEKKKSGRTFSCVPSCENGGTCTAYNRCQCPPGYKGARCQNAICESGCGPKGQCVKPQKCRCHKGYAGRLCRVKVRSKCRTPCLNGARCRHGKCRCPRGFWGKACQYVLHQFLLSRMNRTER